MFLRHTGKTPDLMTVEIECPNESKIRYTIPVIKTQDYSIETIFGKKLYFFIPFYIFRKEKQLKEYEKDEEKLKEIKREFSDIREKLDELTEKEEISEYTKFTLIEMLKKAVSGVATLQKLMK